MSIEEKKQEHIPGHNKEFTIIINGKQVKTTQHKVTYEQILQLANIPQNGQVLYIVTFERGELGKAEGTLSQGDNVVIKSGMVFNVSTTNKS